ncbi:MAG: hypothetical protein QOG65_3011 [Actinomycetota bacterium]|nr:hypothetical protein [Actinomycetota bacterium]
MFGAVLAAHSIAIAVSIGLDGGSFGNVLSAVVASCVVFGLWAALAPRGAAIGLAVILSADTVVSVAVAVSHRNLAVSIPIPFNLGAVAFAIRSFPIASSYLTARRRDEERERDYERQERWRHTSGW